MEEPAYRPKAGLRLRRIGKQYMIVDAGTGRTDLSRVYSLNGTAAFLWERLSEGVTTASELSSLLSREYGVPESGTSADVVRQLEQWRAFGLVEQE